jgi:hypothetical protein
MTILSKPTAIANSPKNKQKNKKQNTTKQNRTKQNHEE